jgi:hypothetical protein
MKRRLGLYVDTIYEVIDTVDGRHLSPSPIDFGFLLFACEVGARFDRLLLFGPSASLVFPCRRYEMQEIR